jgi:hypothetical protein
METSPDESCSLYVIAKPGNYFSDCFVFVMFIFPGRKKKEKRPALAVPAPDF